MAISLSEDKLQKRIKSRICSLGIKKNVFIASKFNFQDKKEFGQITKELLKYFHAQREKPFRKMIHKV